LPISGARQIAGFAIAVGDHDVAEDAEQGEIGGLIALGLPGGAVSLGQRLDAGVGDEVTMLPLRRAASAARPGSVGANQSGG
jgi:hypothetical protein